MIINKYKKKPVIIEAIQYTGDNLQEVLDFTGKHPSWNHWFKDFDDYKNHVESENGVFKIKTLEGDHNAQIGDFIIKGVHGEFYPCKPDIFEKTYEAI